MTREVAALQGFLVFMETAAVCASSQKGLSGTL
jgi:hypothetical protein